jgi:hypothetical protein
VILDAIKCPRCGDRVECDHQPFGEPPDDGSAPIVGCICECGAVFVVRLLADGPDLQPVSPELLNQLARQPAFAAMLEAWMRTMMDGR